ncbi:L,D-transpeptidase family protein [Nocardioides sp. LHG3406-4]|uniref:L,D-transpeptidase family protein n=1 Tax=Nocardioides sp. LHG3406-4 TaxID=2804575 RepID=UPI003CF137FE
MRALRALTVTVLTVAVLAATTVGAALAVRWYADRQSEPAAASDVVPEPTPTPTTPVEVQPATPTAPTTPPPAPEAPELVLSQGDDGEQVRELQHRLFQLAWWPELTTGRYDGETREAVRGFQQKRGLETTGQVDERTWRRLTSMTETPTHDEKFNVLRPGPALLAPGASGEQVRGVQARLKQIAWLFGDVSGTYDDATVKAVRGFQAKREIPATGDIDQRTLDRLTAMTYTPTYEQLHNIQPKPAALDPRCRSGRVLCIDKSSQSLRWVVDGEVVETFEVRFGSDELPTREGDFSVFSKSRDHVSSLYDTSMPFAMFFSGGQAVHYSPDFAANGYAGASHGCVNVRDFDGVAWLFDQVRIGDRVIVYRS